MSSNRYYYANIIKDISDSYTDQLGCRVFMLKMTYLPEAITINYSLYNFYIIQDIKDIHIEPLGLLG